MRIFKHILVGLSVFGLLTACGEGFKAASKKSIVDNTPTAEQLKEDAERTAPNPTGGQATYNSIAQQFADELGTASEDDFYALALDIKAARAIMDIKSNGSVDLRTSLRMSCNDADDREINITNLNWDEITSGRTMSTGMSDNGVSVRAKCVDAQCNELVLVIRRASVTVLMGMKVAFSQNLGANSETRRYDPTNVNLENAYTTAFPVATYRNICADAQAQSEVLMDAFGDTSNNSQSQSQSVSDPTNGSLFFPAPEAGEEEIFDFENAPF